MKQIFSKRQIQVIMLLTAVIFILLCGTAYTVSERKGVQAAVNDGQAAPIKPSHELIRTARNSANENLEWETNVGGSADEEPIAVFNKNNEIYVFGNTYSNDLDFTSATQSRLRGFGARLTLAGRTLSFTVFDFTITKIIPTLYGFAAAGNEGSTAGLYVLDNSLTVTGKTYVRPTHELTACGLYEFDNRYFIVTEYMQEATNRKTLMVSVYTAGLGLEREKVFSHTYGLELLDIIPYKDGYLLAASACFQDLGCLTVASFNMLNSPVFTDFTLGYAYTPRSFIPREGGYAAICDNDGKPELLLIDDDLNKTTVRFLCENALSGEKSLFYAGSIYAFTGEDICELSDDCSKTVGKIPYCGKIYDFAHNGKAAFIIGKNKDELTVIAIGIDKTQTHSLKIVAGEKAAFCANPTNLIIAAISRGTGGDCGDNFGEGDVWIGKFLP